ncbi:MAG: hypothetical protein KGO92_01535 [Bacteroidota bacterium]|nr:hypothetical protein [Bacteroidota bacterium]
MRSKNNLLLIILVSVTIGGLVLLLAMNRYNPKIACEKKGSCPENPKNQESGGGTPVFENSFTHLIVSTKQ